MLFFPIFRENKTRKDTQSVYSYYDFCMTGEFSMLIMTIVIYRDFFSLCELFHIERQNTV